MAEWNPLHKTAMFFGVFIPSGKINSGKPCYTQKRSVLAALRQVDVVDAGAGGDEELGGYALSLPDSYRGVDFFAEFEIGEAKEERQSKEREMIFSATHFVLFSQRPFIKALLCSELKFSQGGLLCFGTSQVTADVLWQLPSLQLVFSSSAGVNHIDLPECNAARFCV
ncbi:hypothetical protein L1049_000390 [Liquidambar formosana]|uniref:D-isomer specific 2-hydroxyacid dehydrogenase catalytic domain-containing protein n=1 Tax=Liquidambar formosana TaxID=63359 RepID=A0AAP0R5B8_LIQFO